MRIDKDEIIEMVVGILKELSPKAEDMKFFKEAAGEIAGAVIHIESEVLKKKMSTDGAKQYLDIQKNAALAILTAIKGITAIRAEKALNNAVKNATSILSTALKVTI